MNKIIKVPVEIKRDGILVEKCELKFREIIHPKGEFVCDKCPAKKICDKLPDPDNLNDSKSNFIIFCVQLDQKRNDEFMLKHEQSNEISELILTKGSFEKLLKYER